MNAETVLVKPNQQISRLKFNPNAYRAEAKTKLIKVKLGLLLSRFDCFSTLM